MKFIIRDDDLNYFFAGDKIEKHYKNIWDICPVSMSVVPYMKGDWGKWVDIFERLGPNGVNDNLKKNFLADDKIYPIHKNESLVDYLHEKIANKQIYLSLHGIHHRNSDLSVQQVQNNYSFLAEFHTSTDLSSNIKDSIIYLEELFNVDITTFTPPQNMLNELGLKSLMNNGLNICHNFNLRDIKTLFKLGILNSWKIFNEKKTNSLPVYPFPIQYGNIKFINHIRLQPNTRLDLLFKLVNKVYELDGVFVLSTHSYAFNYPMKYDDFTMGEALELIVNRLKNKSRVQFTTLEKAFE